MRHARPSAPGGGLAIRALIVRIDLRQCALHRRAESVDPRGGVGVLDLRACPPAVAGTPPCRRTVSCDASYDWPKLTHCVRSRNCAARPRMGERDETLITIDNSRHELRAECDGEATALGCLVADDIVADTREACVQCLAVRGWVLYRNRLLRRLCFGRENARAVRKILENTGKVDMKTAGPDAS
jgi:hypothetical protein